MPSSLRPPCERPRRRPRRRPCPHPRPRPWCRSQGTQRVRPSLGVLLGGLGVAGGLCRGRAQGVGLWLAAVVLVAVRVRPAWRAAFCAGDDRVVPAQVLGRAARRARRQSPTWARPGIHGMRARRRSESVRAGGHLRWRTRAGVTRFLGTASHRAPMTSFITCPIDLPWAG